MTICRFSVILQNFFFNSVAFEQIRKVLLIIITLLLLFQAYYDSDVGIWEFGTTICAACVVGQSLHLAIETRSWVSKFPTHLFAITCSSINIIAMLHNLSEKSYLLPLIV